MRSNALAKAQENNDIAKSAKNPDMLDEVGPNSYINHRVNRNNVGAVTVY